MANQEQLDILKQGVEVWNTWRLELSALYPDLAGADLSNVHLYNANLRRADLSKVDLSDTILTKADLSDADLSGANLRSADLRGAALTKANLSGADLSGANLSDSNLQGADLNSANLRDVNFSWTRLNDTNLSDADLMRADLSEADLRFANLRNANLRFANFRDANLRNANLSGTDLRYANLSMANLSKANFGVANLSDADLSQTIIIATNFTDATLNRCRVYGTSAWNVKLEGTKQESLIITSDEEATVTVDTLEVAQFIYLLLNNTKIRDVIDTIAKKAILILGHFTPERKAVLEAIREMLRQKGYLPILFDFDKPAHRDVTETVSTLAHLSRFVIADITDAKSIPQELMTIVPNLPSVPVQPLILESQSEYGMFEHFTKFPWVLPIHHYQDLESLLASLQAKVIEPAEQKVQELEKR